jgi:hypothetical protein
MKDNEYVKESGETLKFPNGCFLKINETSNCVYKIELLGPNGEEFQRVGLESELDSMVEASFNWISTIYLKK